MPLFCTGNRARGTTYAQVINSRVSDWMTLYISCSNICNLHIGNFKCEVTVNEVHSYDLRYCISFHN